MRGSGLRSPSCEYSSPGEAGLGHTCGERAPPASPLRPFEGWVGNIDSRELGPRDIQDGAGPLCHHPAPSSASLKGGCAFSIVGA